MQHKEKESAGKIGFMVDQVQDRVISKVENFLKSVTSLIR